MALKEGRSKSRWNFFKDPEMDFQFARTMAVMSEKGAEVGECFNVKRTMKKMGMKQLSEAWLQIASFVEAKGLDQEKAGQCSRQFPACFKLLPLSDDGLIPFG